MDNDELRHLLEMHTSYVERIRILEERRAAFGTLSTAETVELAKAKREKPLAKWLCNHEIEKMRLTADKGAYSYFGHEPGHFDIDGKRHVVENPKEGRVVAARH